MKRRIDMSTVLNGAPTSKETHDWCPPLDRRAALRFISMSAVAAMAGCGGSKSASAGTQSTTTTLSASNTSVAENSNVTLTATISPSAATGTATFDDGSTSLGTGRVSSGGATLKTAFTTAGTHTLSAVYGGDSSYTASTSAFLSITVLGTTCSETVEGEEGPYFVDDSASGFDRSNILSNLDGSGTQSGVPFTLPSMSTTAKMDAVQWKCTGPYLALQCQRDIFRREQRIHER